MVIAIIVGPPRYFLAALAASLLAFTTHVSAFTTHRKNVLKAGRLRSEDCQSLLLASLPQSEKVIYFVRHAEATHNLEGPVGISALLNEADTDLTPAGAQAARLVSREPYLAPALSQNKSQRAQLIVTSPMRRAMRTALYAFGNAEPPVPFVLEPKLQEVASFKANTADPAKGMALLQELDRPGMLEQYTTLPSGWHRQPGDEVDMNLVKARFRNLTDMLLARPEQCIIAVTHGQFIAENLGYLLANGEALPYSLSAKGKWSSILPPRCLRGR
mmetsp:Transcript_28739/g.82219  ORF Transcript_28739/g.82219 Transcript_28739/m.82219 type:complete len:273 (+) Transcript_28739:105-923(+)